MAGRRGSFWIGLGICAIAVAAAVVAIARPWRGSESTTPVETVLSGREAEAALPPSARRVARRFVLDTAQRRNMREAWKLAGDDVRADASYESWLAGDVALPRLAGTVKQAPLAVDWLAADSAQIQMLLVPRRGQPFTRKALKPLLLTVRVDRIGAAGARRWVVGAVGEAFVHSHPAFAF